MHEFVGKWITDKVFFDLKPQNVFHRQYAPFALSKEENLNCHILFRKTFFIEQKPSQASIYISADDYYKLYINGRFVGQGPAMSYHSNYNYNVIDVTDYLQQGSNIIAVHTLYQGLINRVWQSGDSRHGLLLDLVADGKNIVVSDASFLTCRHTGYHTMGTTGYETQFLETYDSNAPQVGFSAMDFDDSAWEHAKVRQFADYTMVEQPTKMLAFENVFPIEKAKRENIIFLDFGACYVGYLFVKAVGPKHSQIIVRCGQELNDDGTVRYELRANCNYEEGWVLSGNEDTLDWFDYKAFRYAELVLPEGCELKEVALVSRHYPFALKAGLKPEYAGNPKLKAIWDLCLHTQKYGVQEAILDCMEREKGFYMGDGCYTALTHLALTKDDSMVRKLIDDGFFSMFITEGCVTCLDCSFMQEIAEYPLILVSLVLWHYRFTGDLGYLRANYGKVKKLLDTYKKNYEKDALLGNLDKWCVVEWPKNFQDDYDSQITEGQVSITPHVVMNAYYLNAVRTVNEMATILGEPIYREEAPLKTAFWNAFYDKETKLFRDCLGSSHFSLIGNVFAYSFDLCPEAKSGQKILQWVRERRVSSLSLFATFPLLAALCRHEKWDVLEEMLCDEGAWLRMLREGATTTFESWGKDCKWNTSLFHMIFSYGALFLADVDLLNLFR